MFQEVQIMTSKTQPVSRKYVAGMGRHLYFEQQWRRRIADAQTIFSSQRG